MGTQQAKFIDITRTFVPLDPKSFPKSMHGTRDEDNPEQRIPVMAYEGKNIIPTAHGYSSYFGINRELGIDALPARCDKIFVAQNDHYRNVLIALTEQGIYIKQANTAGAWTQAVVMAAALDDTVHYEWTTAVINNQLYAYRQGNPSYQKIVSDLTNGVAITSIVPSYLNMAGQVGIFRAGGRLGFWDSADSIAWSNLENFADFTPSVQTLANSVKFSDVNGRIVTIQSHGAGFVIYATKSIVYVRANVEATFQWDPKVVFSTNGIVYPRQVDLATPDTTHFAYTTIGLYKIENGEATNIVPEVTDVLEKLSVPIYVRVMEGRYLFIEILDENFLESLVQFSVGTIDEIQYVFPGVTGTLEDAVAEEILQGTNMCMTLDRMNDGIFATPPADPGDKKAGTGYTPKWVAYLSKKGQWGPVSTWTNTPVTTLDPNNVEKNHCPVEGAGNLLSANNTTSSGKTVLNGSDLYIDGIWTMERFVAVQQAIWDLEEESIDTFLNSAQARSSYGEKITYQGTDAGAATVTVDKQLINTYAHRFTKGYFGFSACEFWLTRYCYQAMKLYRIKRNRIDIEDTRTNGNSIGYANWYAVNGYGGPTAAYGTFTAYGTPEEVANAQWGSGWSEAGLDVGVTYSWAEAASADGFMTYVAAKRYTHASSPYSITVYMCFYNPDVNYSHYVNSTFPTPGSPTTTYLQHLSGRYRKTERMWANNYGEVYDVNPFVADAGYCTLAGWDYTKSNDTPGFIAAAACAADAEFPPGSSPRLATESIGATIGNDGSFCSLPFEPVTIPGSPPVELNWPTTTVTAPSGTFLLQDGSIAPVYPLMYGALVYDLFLKKWGKMNQSYRHLLDYYPINNAGSGGVPFSSFGILGGILAGDNKIKLFDNYPITSYITYGKIGYYRLGMTACEEVIAHFAEQSTGYLKVDTSLNGREVETSLTKTQGFTDAMSARLTGAYPGSWHNITISGNFNLSYLEYRAFNQGKR